MSEMRRSFLKGYLVTLIAEGEFQGMKSTTAAATHAVKIFARDSLSVFGEFAKGYAEAKFQKASTVVAEKLEGLARGVADKIRNGDFGGVRKVVDDMAATYEHGLDVLTARR